MLLETLINATPALAKLMSCDLPIVLAFRLGVMVKTVDPILQSYNERRNALIRQYAEPDEKGNRQVPPEHMQEFGDKLKVVLAEEIEVPGIPEVTLKDLEGIKMTAQHMAALTPWVLKA